MTQIPPTIQHMIDNPHIVALFDYGSVVYGTYQAPQSDRDYIAIVDNSETALQCSQQELAASKVDITIWTEKDFHEKIAQHEITALECLFLPAQNIHKKTKDFPFSLDLSILRSSISAKSSNSWVKAKKKFLVEKDFNPYIGKKSAWHSLRLLDFGKQIASTGAIYDYSSANALYNPIMETSDWPTLESAFKKIYNEKASAFKAAAPKAVPQTPALKR